MKNLFNEGRFQNYVEKKSWHNDSNKSWSWRKSSRLLEPRMKTQDVDEKCIKYKRWKM